MAWRDASQRASAAFAKVPQSLVCQPIQPAGCDGHVELSFPRRSVELREPAPELRELVSRELANGDLELLNALHRIHYTNADVEA